ncbi:hypothetical protein BpHYR1_034658 [Brachionus plicatilis]|uniref:Uncharacterized protein n=1 Tax=Brachionus plicatilis TaxID=10195 RepID=A0A3M7SYG5_BRAPC|nr:hypothetical protein BpHYR1_034658 [Brachionus plicatilis]
MVFPKWKIETVETCGSNEKNRNSETIYHRFVQYAGLRVGNLRIYLNYSTKPGIYISNYDYLLPISEINLEQTIKFEYVILEEI